MRKWLALGLLGLVVVWGPYVYSELVRSPARAHGSARRVLWAFGDDPSEAGSDAPAPAPADPAPADPKLEPTAEAVAAASDKPAPQGEAEPKPEAEPGRVAAVAPAAAAAVTPEQPQPSAATSGEPAHGPKDEHAHAEEPPAPPPAPLPSELAPTFRKTFENEPRDGFWAADEEPRLTKLFRGAGVAATDVGEVACRKTVCRVTWNAAATDNDATGKLYAALRDGYGTGLALDSGHVERDEHALLFVLRKGYQLAP